MVSRVRTALFVDFDNVFGSLYNLNPSAAERFATYPDEWLRFFETGQHAAADTDERHSRSILLRKCYLNPSGSLLERHQARSFSPARNYSANRLYFSRYRAHFTRAAFSVVDCPPLTQRTKNSADIVMVMDILDALSHETRFDEFIILSGDADFTPVLFRLRAHDRLTTIFANALATAPYRAACDFLVTEEDFIEDALQISAPEPVAMLPEPVRETMERHAGSDLVKVLARDVLEFLDRNGPARIEQLMSIFNRYPEFKTMIDGRRWFGFGSLRALVEAIAQHEPRIAFDRTAPDHWMIASRTTGEGEAPAAPSEPRFDADAMPQAQRILNVVREALTRSSNGVALGELVRMVREAVPDVETGGWPGAATFREFLANANDPHIAIRNEGLGYAYDPIAVAPSAPATPDATSLSSRILQFVRDRLTYEPHPIVLAKLAQLVRSEFPEVQQGWPGASSFGDFLRSATDPNIRILSDSPGYAWDPQRHSPNDIPGRGLPGVAAPLAALIERVARVAGSPRLDPDQYRMLFEALAAELDSVREEDRPEAWTVSALSAAVHDRCAAHGYPINRSAVTYVITSLDDAYDNWDKEALASGGAARIAELFRRTVERHCEEARLDLTADELMMLREWIGHDPTMTRQQISGESAAETPDPGRSSDQTHTGQSNPNPETKTGMEDPEQGLGKGFAGVREVIADLNTED